MRRKGDECPEALPPRKEIMLPASPQYVPVGGHQDPEANRKGRWEANIGKDPSGEHSAKLVQSQPAP